MADNLPVTSGSATYTAATDKVTYSGDANVDVQLVKSVAVTGAEGSKTVVDIYGSAGTASAAVLTIQGIASGTVVPISDGGGNISIDDGGGNISIDDGGNSITVDGTVAATQSGTWTVQPGNTANTTAWFVAGGKTNNNAAPGATNVGALPAVATAAAPSSTEGNQVALSTDLAGALRVGTHAVTQSGTWNVGTVTSVTNVVHVDDNSSTISIDDGAGSITVDGTVAISGTVSVNSHAVTNAGTFSVQESGAALTSLQLIDDTVVTEDTAHSSGDKGIMALAVRRDANTSLSDTTGDYTPLQVDATGSLKVAIISGAGSGGTSIADDAAFTVGTTSLTPVGGTYKSTLDSVDDGDAGAFAMTIKRALYTALLTPNGDSAMDDTNDAVKVAIVADSVGSSVDTEDGSVAAGASNVAQVIAQGYVYDGTNWVRRVTPHIIDDAAFTPATSGVMMAGFEFDDTGTDSVDEGDAGAARMSANRNVYMQIRDAAGNERGVNVNASNQLAVAGPVTNAGTFVTQENGAALTALQLIDDPVIADDAAFTPATSKVMMAGFEADESSTDSVDEGDAGAARMTLDRKQIVTVQPHTTGGLSTFMASGSDGSSILVATAQAIKASAGQMYGYYLYNPEAAVTFVHFYNTASASVTVGTTNPLFTIPVPAGAAANLMFPCGVTFSNAGWSCAATTTAGGNTAPSTGVSAVIWYL